MWDVCHRAGGISNSALDLIFVLQVELGRQKLCQICITKGQSGWFLMLAPPSQSMVVFRQELSLRTGHFTKQNRIPFGRQSKCIVYPGGLGREVGGPDFRVVGYEIVGKAKLMQRKAGHRCTSGQGHKEEKQSPVSTGLLFALLCLGRVSYHC